jgi:hypothetical protein
VLTVDQLYVLVDLMPDRWNAFLLLKTFASLRWGEITAPTRNDLDLERQQSSQLAETAIAAALDPQLGRAQIMGPSRMSWGPRRAPDRAAVDRHWAETFANAVPDQG